MMLRMEWKLMVAEEYHPCSFAVVGRGRKIVLDREERTRAGPSR